MNTPVLPVNLKTSLAKIHYQENVIEHCVINKIPHTSRQNIGV